MAGYNWDGHFFNPENNINIFTDHLSTAKNPNARLRLYHSVADGKEAQVFFQQYDAEAVREGPEEGVYAPASQAQSGTTTEAEGIEQRQSVGEGQGVEESSAEIEQTGGDFPQTAQGSAEQHDEDDEHHHPGREDPRTGD